MNMKPNPFDPAGFPTTHWSMMLRAGGDDVETKRAAMVGLIQAYTPALRAHLVRRRRASPEAAEDAVQGFLTDKVLQRNLVGKAQQHRGRFRTFLLTALDGYWIDLHRHHNAAKRGGAAGTEPLDQASPAAANETDIFDTEWARQVLWQAMEATEQQLSQSGRREYWQLLEARLVRPILGNEASPGVTELAAALGFADAGAASNALITAKRLFGRQLREVIGRYAADADAIEEEIHDLFRILAAAGAG